MLLPGTIAGARHQVPAPGKIGIYWLGGAGLVIRFDNGIALCIDPYLSDAAERLFGFKRLVRAPITDDQLCCDVLLISHEHGDHLDIDSFDAVAATNPSMKVFAPKSCNDFLRDHFAGYTQIHAGWRGATDKIGIHAIQADHGELSPDALVRVGTGK